MFFRSLQDSEPASTPINNVDNLDNDFVSRLSRLRIRYIEDNVIILGNVIIPTYVKLIASLGPKFSFGAKIKELNDLDTITCLNNIGDIIDDYEAWKEFSNFKINLGTDIKFTKAQQFLKLQFYRTRKFLKANSNVVITSADKGGKIVITDKETYEAKMNIFMNDCIEKKVFFKVNLPYEDRRSFIESKFEWLTRNINPYLLNDVKKNYLNCCHQLAPEPHIIARLYGFFKIQRVDVPMRPIISTTNCMGQSLIQWLLTKLEIITSNISGFKINNSKSLFDLLDGFILNKGCILSTSDFDSMYTNINFGKTKNIIKKYYHLIAKETTVPIDTFLSALSFFIEDDAYFSFNDVIYRQCKGLAMGNALSGILAEIYLSNSLNTVMKGMPKGSLDFIFIFMDDLLYGVQRDCKDILTERIKQISGIKLKSTEEDEKHSVNYLNIECNRNTTENNKIEFKWWQKPESSGRILDYHSFHPLHMKINIVSEFVKNALRLTSKKFWQETIIAVKKVLLNSNYPSRLIKRIISTQCKRLGTIEVTSSTGDVDFNAITTHNLMIKKKLPATIYPNGKLQRKSIRNKKYLAVPYHPNLISSIRSLLNILKIKNISIAPRIQIKNRSHIYTNMKDKRKLSGTVNASFKINCCNCDFEWTCKTRNLDVSRTALHHLNNKFSLPFKHAKENQLHKLIIDKSSIKKFRDKRELELFNER